MKIIDQQDAVARMSQSSSNLEQLKSGANAGNLAAMAALGRHLLSNASTSHADLDEARRLLAPAADTGNAEAAFLVSRLIGMDAGTADGWVRALNYLTRSAAAGYPVAQVELAFLAGRPEVVEAVANGQSIAPGVWAKLHGEVDPQIWTAQVPPVGVVSSAPYIAVAENFVSHDICDWLVHAARNSLGPSTSYDRANQRSVASHKVATPELDMVVTSVILRIAALTGVPINGKEGASVLRYQPGEQFEPHYDFLDPRLTPSLAQDIRNSGQRVITFIIYLSEDFDGGETYFPKVGYRFKGRKGDAVLFRNVDAAGEPDYAALHAGLAPTRGEKWAFVRVCTRIPAVSGAN
jgi:prolyl 4-hydroxylase